MSEHLPAQKARLFEALSTFTLAEAEQYVASMLASEAINTNEPFHNRFFHEFLPVVTIARAVGSTDTCIEFSGASHGLDATLILGEARSRQSVEMTAAIDGQQEALRMEHLKKFGSAPSIGYIKATGAKNRKDRQIECTDAEWEPASVYNERLVGWVRRALEGKQSKARSRPAYAGAWLGIAIPNYPPTEYKKKRFDPLFVELLMDPKGYAPFPRVFIVSTVGDYIFDSASVIQR